jgi:hypothetical protein
MSKLRWLLLSGTITAMTGLALGVFVHPLVGWCTVGATIGSFLMTPREKRTFGNALLTTILTGGVLAFLYLIWWERFL